MRRPYRCGLKSASGEMRTVAVGRCKNAGNAHRRRWEFASVPFDEVPTGRYFGVSGGCSWWCGWSADLLCSGEGLDDEHRGTAVPAHEGGPNGAVPGLGCG